MNEAYRRFIENRFRIIDKQSCEVPFTLNAIQDKYVTRDASGSDVILKARQQGFSSVILGAFTADFLLKDNCRSVVVADIDDNAQELLDRVRHYIRAYEDITNTKVPLKYNSKSELYNEGNGSRYTIGTAKNAEFGRSKTINNLHLSEFAFYPNPQSIFAGAVQAVVPNGRTVIETTANGFNYFKSFWDECMLGEQTFKPLFYKASDFYDAEFLETKRKQLKRLFAQEYPETPEEAFLTSGDLFFDPIALKHYLDGGRQPMTEGLLYV